MHREKPKTTAAADPAQTPTTLVPPINCSSPAFKPLERSACRLRASSGSKPKAS